MPLNPGMFLSRQLEQVLPKLYEKRYASLWADEGIYLPATGDLEMGADTLVEETVTELGEAAIVADGANDVPVADALIDEAKFKAVAIATHFSYSILELNKAEKAGRPLRDVKAKAADRALRQRTHKLAVFGSAKHGMTGFFNDANVPVVSSSYDADDAATTFADHVDFFADNFTKVKDETNLVEGIEYVLVPAKLRNIWAKSFQTGNGQSVLRYILENYGAASGGTLRGIIEVNETRSADLEANGLKAAGTNEDRIVFLPNNPDAAERKFYGMQILPPEVVGMGYKTYMYCGTSEPIIHYPGSMLYVDIPKVV